MKSEIRDIAAAIILLFFSIVGIFLANDFSQQQIQYGPGFFPKLVLTLLAFTSLILFISGIVRYKRNDQKIKVPKHVLISVAVYIVLLIIYINLFFYIGFIISTIIFLLLGQYLFGLRKPVWLLTISLTIPFILNYIFTSMFKIPLP